MSYRQLPVGNRSLNGQLTVGKRSLNAHGHLTDSQRPFLKIERPDPPLSDRYIHMGVKCPETDS